MASMLVLVKCPTMTPRLLANWAAVLARAMCTCIIVGRGQETEPRTARVGWTDARAPRSNRVNYRARVAYESKVQEHSQSMYEVAVCYVDILGGGVVRKTHEK